MKQANTGLPQPLEASMTTCAVSTIWAEAVGVSMTSTECTSSSASTASSATR